MVLKSISYYFLAFCIIFSFILLQIPTPLYFLFNPDQGMQLAYADRVSLGSHPFVDLAGGIYGPLVFYSSALGQYLSDNRLIGEVSLILIGYTFSYLLLFSLLIRITTKLSIALFFLVLLLLLIPNFYKYYIVLCPALFLTSLFYFSNKQTLLSLASISSSIAICFLFRIDYGVYSFLTSIVAIIILTPNNYSRIISLSWKLALFVILFSSPWLLVLAINNALIDALIDILEVASSGGSGLTKPAPSLDFDTSIFGKNNSFFFLFWSFALLPYFAIAIFTFTQNNLTEKNKKFFIATAIYSALVFLQASHRSDPPHLLQVLPPQIVLLCSLLTLLSHGLYQRYKTVMIFNFFVIASTSILIFRFSFPSHFSHIEKKISNLQKNHMVYFYHRDDLRKHFKQILETHPRSWTIDVVEYIHENTKPSERVLFYPYLPQFYYLAERPFGTSVSHLIPGYKNKPEEQLERFQEIERDNIRYITDLPNWSYDGSLERNAHGYMSLLYKDIEENYTIEKRIGPAIIWKRLDPD